MPMTVSHTPGRLASRGWERITLYVQVLVVKDQADLLVVVDPGDSAEQLALVDAASPLDVIGQIEQQPRRRRRNEPGAPMIIGRKTAALGFEAQSTTSKPSNTGCPSYVPAGARAWLCALRNASELVQVSKDARESHVVCEA